MRRRHTMLLRQHGLHEQPRAYHTPRSAIAMPVPQAMGRTSQKAADKRHAASGAGTIHNIQHGSQDAVLQQGKAHIPLRGTRDTAADQYKRPEIHTTHRHTTCMTGKTNTYNKCLSRKNNHP